MDRVKIWKYIGIIFVVFIMTMITMLIVGADITAITMEKEFISGRDSLTDEQKAEFNNTLVDSDKKYNLFYIEEKSELMEKQPYEHVIERYGMTKDEINPERVIQLNIDGKSVPVYLQDVTYEESVVTDRKEVITKSIEHKDVDSEPKNVDKSIEVEYRDKYTGEVIPVTLEYVNLEKISEPTWKTDLSKEFVVEGYGSDLYDMGGTLIPHTEKGPDFSGHEDILYKYFNLDKKKNIIQNIVWKDAEFEKGGVPCRKVSVTGKRLVGTWKANYINESVELSDATGYKAYIKYASQPSYLDAEYKITAVARYINVSRLRHYLLGVIVGFAGIIAFIVIKYRKVLFHYGEV